jgi:hypothetical protein
MKRSSGLLIGLALATCAGSALADPVYRWVDPQGVVSYGTKPPPNAAGLRTVVLDEALPSSNPSASNQGLSQDLAEAERQRLERQKAQDKADADHAKAEARRQKSILEAQRQRHEQDCVNGALSPSDCNDVNLGYYPVIGYRGPRIPQIAQTPVTPTAPPVVHQNAPISKPAPRPAAN